jgi:hypothetical protein
LFGGAVKKGEKRGEGEEEEKGGKRKGLRQSHPCTCLFATLLLPVFAKWLGE